MRWDMKKKKNKEENEIPSGATDPNATPSPRPFDDAVKHLQQL
jgi:hypothetical protein